MLVAVAVVLTGMQFAERWNPVPGGAEGTVVSSAPELTGADVVARHAVAAFANSAVGTDATLGPAQRGADLPSDPVVGLTRQTAAGPVQIVLPGGLGPAQSTPGGQVVYPDRGAGFDFLAENTTSGTRTVARIPDASGPRAVTTFVRTPARTVMLAHTNGFVTINRATPTAETVAVFSPAETRDATGALVPASYVVRQLRSGLYQMTEVIDPHPGTVWPVFVDPPLHLGGAGGAPLPQGFLDTLSSAADTVAGAVSTAASATVTGAKAVGVFVKENPLESAMLVGGVALAVTGVGGPAGAAAIAAATVNLSSAGLDVAAAAMPDNQLLGDVATYVGAVSMITPQGAAKKAVTEGLETLAEQAVKNTDAVIDVAKAAPTPPATLANEITAAPGKVDVPEVSTPKAPNAPPAGGSLPPGHGPDGPRSLPAGCTLDCGHQTPAPAGVYSEPEVPGHYNANLTSIQSGQPNLLNRVLTKAEKDANRQAATGHLPKRPGSGQVWHEYPHASSQQGGTGADTFDLPKTESDVEMRIMGDLYQRQSVKSGDQYTTAYRGDDGLTRCSSCAIDRRNGSTTPNRPGLDNRQSEVPRGGLNAGSNNTSGNDRGGSSDRKSGNSNPKKKKTEKKKKRKTQAQKRRRK